jgi:hypothetical protein
MPGVSGVAEGDVKTSAEHGPNHDAQTLNLKIEGMT